MAHADKRALTRLCSLSCVCLAIWKTLLATVSNRSLFDAFGYFILSGFRY